jgi:hypothetical protein
MTNWRSIVIMTLIAGCGGEIGDGTGSGGVAVMSIVGARPTPPPMGPKVEGSVSIASTGNGIGYNGGPIMSGTTNLYYIWYGNWNGNSATTILNDWGNTVGASSNYFVNVTYDDNGGHHINSSVRVAGSTTDNYSRGATIVDGDIWTIVNSALSSHRLPVDANGVYMVLTSQDVNESSGFCTQFCGWHTYAGYNGTNIKFAFIGNPARCNGSCGGLGTTPNGNAGADDMASIMFHELSETVSDPQLNAWGDSNGENGDKCAWNFGATYRSGNGSPANAHLGNRDFLMQQMWANAGGGYCAESLRLPPGGTGGPTRCGVLSAGQVLTAGQSLGSCDGRFSLAMQYDGNLVLYQGGGAIWASNTYLSQGYAAIMQNDGNFVLYDVNGRALWASGTYGHAGDTVAVQNDGNLVVYNSSGGALWASNTCCR